MSKQTITYSEEFNREAVRLAKALRLPATAVSAIPASFTGKSSWTRRQSAPSPVMAIPETPKWRNCSAKMLVSKRRTKS